MCRLLFALAVLAPPAGARAEFLTFDSAEAWASWQIPAGLVRIDEEGRLALVRFRRDIDPVRDAGAFEHDTLTRGRVRGGIWRAGSGASTAPRLIDGDAATYWQPDPDDPLARWEVEIDLGRAVLARRIVLRFPDREGARPLRQFTVYTATGAAISSRDDIFRFEQVFQTTLPNEATAVAIDLRGRKDTARALDAGLEAASHFRTVQYIRIGVDEKSAGAAVSEVEVDAVGDNIALGLLERGGALRTGLVVRDAQGMVDGSMNTYANKFTTYQATSGWKSEGLWWEMDLGAQFWLDGLFAYFLDPGEGASGSSVRNAGTGFSFLYSDGRRTTSGEVDYTRLVVEGAEEGTSYIRQRHFYYLFAPRKVRFLFWHGFLTAAEWHARMPELMLFAAGYPAQVVLRSDFIDLGQVAGDGRAKAIAALHWKAELPPGTRLQLRSRSGSTLREEYTFRDKIGAETTEARYNSLPAVLRGRVDTTVVAGEDWSDWSNVYPFSGGEFQSETPRRFVQLEAILSTDDPQVTPRLRSLSIEFGEALVQEVRGLVSPRQVRPNEATRFTYALWSRTVAGDEGFDRVRLVAAGGTFEGDVDLRLGGRAVEPADVELGDDSLLVVLPRVVRGDSLALGFTARVLRNAAVFRAELGHGARPGPWQSAAPAIRRGQSVFLPALVDSEALIGDLVLSSAVLTPNGDGIHDTVELRFVVFKLDAATPVVTVCDMSGRRVVQMRARAAGGRASFSWDGRDERGRRVPPGLYVVRLDLGAASGEDVALRALAVAY